MSNEPAVRGYVVGPGEGVPDRTPDVKASGWSTSGSLTVMELPSTAGRRDIQSRSTCAPPLAAPSALSCARGRTPRLRPWGDPKGGSCAVESASLGEAA
jgi:hypothetical protein